MLSICRRHNRTDRAEFDAAREHKIEAVTRLAERFTYDLGLLIAGHPVGFEDYVDPATAQRLQICVEPFLASGDAMRPNFGDYGELRIQGYLQAGDEPIHAEIDFDDQSIRETAGGDLVPYGKRRMRLSLLIDPSGSQVRNFALRPVVD